MRPAVQLPPTLPVWPRVHLLRQVAQPEPKSAAWTEPVSTPAADSLLATLLAERRTFLRFLARRVRSPQMAEDILQTAYLRALEHAAELRAGESATAWFYRILRNAVIDFYRHRAVEDRALDEWAAELETEVAANDGSRDTACRCMTRLLPTLRPAYAAILRAVDLDEGELAGFAAAQGITAGNATVQLHRARRAMRERLIACCGSCAEHGCLDCTCRQPA